ncbi:MAG: endonuclease [Sphingobacteriales bacterium]|nr:endonuclease [Sphingobacteriales bacterium]
MPVGTASSYATKNWTGDGGISWTATDTRADQSITGLAAGVRNGSVTSGNIPNGIGNLSFKYKYLFTGSAASLDVKVNGVTVGTVAVPSSQTTATTATLNNINVSGTFTLSLVQTVASSRVAIDDIAWTGFGVSCTAPVTQVSTASFSSVTATGFTVNWTAGSGTNSLVVLKQGGAVSGTPSSGTAYTANTAFGSGQTIAAGEYVVYNSTGNSVAVTGLTAGTTYHVSVFTFNSADNCYNTAAPATNNTATSCLQPTTQVSTINSTPGSTSATINWSGGNGSSSLVRFNAANSFTSPSDGVTYAASATYSGGEQTVYASTGSSVTVSGLTASTTYYVTVYTYNDCGGTPDYLTTGTSVHSFSTTAGGTGEPAGYYSAATGLTCSALKTSLSNIITTGMTPKTYGNLWTQYLVSDIKPREVGPGTSTDVIWDIYSDNPAGADPYNFTPGPVASGGQQDNGGAAGGEGILYNREHSVPQSWFGASAASGSVGPESDYFHIYPTDKIVNANRSNFIYGEISAPTITSMNGSKLGPNTVAGLTGSTAFEPIDAFKGDLARSFFYFVTRYQSSMSAWQTLSVEGNLAFDGTTWPSIELPYLQMMIRWHNLDPVSQKEIDRNNAGYVFQGNRNPYIDHPEFVNQVWVSGCGLILPVTITGFTGGYVLNAVQLKWQVATADGFDRFDVERSTDGGRTFQKTGTVNWVQNADKFSFQDGDNSLKGDVFYRLKLVDQNGTFTYSKVIRVMVPASDFTAAFFPNPATDQLGVSFRKPLTADCSVTITDLAGRKLKTLKLVSGQQQYSIPVAELAGGTYLLQLRSDGQLIHTKFIKQ